MSKEQYLRVRVPDDFEDPIELVREAVDRYLEEQSPGVVEIVGGPVTSSEAPEAHS